MARLEDQFGRIEGLLKSVDDRLRLVELNVAELKGRIVNLPSTWAMMTGIVGSQIAFAGVLAAFAKLAWGH